MSVETTIRTISLVLAPVVMISSCMLFLNCMTHIVKSSMRSCMDSALVRLPALKNKFGSM